MLGKALRDSVLRSSALRATSVFPQFSMRAFASNAPLNEKEKGDERVFFTKNDEKALKDLMKKIQKQTAIVEPTKAEEERQKKKLSDIFNDHKLDTQKHQALFDALLEWKRHL